MFFNDISLTRYDIRQWAIKLNGQLSEDWCVGDQVICTYVEMLDRFGMIDIDVETFPIDSVDETYCARPGVETDFFIKINL